MQGLLCDSLDTNIYLNLHIRMYSCHDRTMLKDGRNTQLTLTGRGTHYGVLFPTRGIIFDGIQIRDPHGRSNQPSITHPSLPIQLLNLYTVIVSLCTFKPPPIPSVGSRTPSSLPGAYDGRNRTGPPATSDTQTTDRTRPARPRPFTASQ